MHLLLAEERVGGKTEREKCNVSDWATHTHTVTGHHSLAAAGEQRNLNTVRFGCCVVVQ